MEFSKKKTSVFFVMLTLLITHKLPAVADTFDTGLMNSQNMKEFNIFERNAKLPAILVGEQTNRRYLLNSITFEKNTAFTSEDLTKMFSQKLGSRIDSFDITEMKRALLKKYKANGYKSAIVNISAQSAKDGCITFTIYEGPKAETNSDKTTSY